MNTYEGTNYKSWAIDELFPIESESSVPWCKAGLIVKTRRQVEAENQ